MNLSVVKIKKDAIMPAYQTDGAAGMDLHACIDSPMKIQPLERAMVPTGIAIALPNGYEAQVRARSGLASKHGIALVNGVGTVDADYRGEIGVLLVNLSKETFVVKPNMRIAQLVVARVEKVNWVEKDSLDITDRAEGGFGSTGTREART